MAPGTERNAAPESRPAERRSPSGPGELDATAVSLREGFDAPEPFLEALAEAPVAASPSLDLGEDLRIEGARVQSKQTTSNRMESKQGLVLTVCRI
jgi:hypothetical protein